MLRAFRWLPLLSLLLAAPAFARTHHEREKAQERALVHHTIGHKILLYIPNRFLDVFDVVRFRVRLGPGIAIDIRATEWVDAYFGAYASVYMGLPGPRNHPFPKSPIGIESRAGVEFSKFDLTASAPWMRPDYGPTEFGVGVQAVLVGVDVGVDPGEFVDLIGGIFFWDPKHDDL